MHKTTFQKMRVVFGGASVAAAISVCSAGGIASPAFAAVPGAAGVSAASPVTAVATSAASLAGALPPTSLAPLANAIPAAAAATPEPVCAGEGDSVLTVSRAASNPYDDAPRDMSTWRVEAHSVPQFPQVSHEAADVDALIEWFKGIDDGDIAALPLAQTAALTGESVQIEGLPAGYYVIRAVHGEDAGRITKPSLVSVPAYVPEYGCWNYSAEVALKSMPNTPPTPPPPPENQPHRDMPKTGAAIMGTALMALGSLSLGVVLTRRRKQERA